MVHPYLLIANMYIETLDFAARRADRIRCEIFRTS